ncbi:hypothetical protein F5B22DRAFT_559969 [Xylaria bambusicola]|uniref:uncharacterized protein n=1 Tax=Xylaria bambusicola TaxID=326684 RepID=UPI0020089547|nr:uncharacterized protein F5B22DRAFT_559969 [Xylaria bambusicola]KAI0503205.1 hypothetical protein F5B22DRAFT_559969 [Xylaria bambusicola]
MTGSATTGMVNYVLTGLTLFILISRIVLTLIRRDQIDASFALVVSSILIVIGRIVTNIYYLRYGNAADAIKHAGYFDESNHEYIKIGTILVLLARVLITAIIWLQICILLIFYSRITRGVNWVAKVTTVTWALVGATFIGIILVTFLECRPISLYWQTSPDPGECVHAYGQLITQTVSNIVLDLLLIAIAYPIICLRKRTVAEHITLYTLVALGTFCIVISILRLVWVHDSGSAQVTRSLWASVQMLVSTFVANAPNIYGSIRALRIKKSSAASSTPAQYHLSTIGSSNRTRPTTESWLRMDDDDYIALEPNRAKFIRPLPPTTSLYNEPAPTPYVHHADSKDSTSALNRLSEPDLEAPSLRTQSSETRTH